MTKYNSTDGKTTLDAEDDAATANWGGDWRMPTEDEFDELLENTTSSWTEVNGVSGLLLTSTANTNTLFFPAVGGALDGGVSDVGDVGCYWSDSLGSMFVNDAYGLGFDSEGHWLGAVDRSRGYAVRPVSSQNI